MQALQGVQSIINGIVGKSARTVVPTGDGLTGPPRLCRRNEAIVKNLWNSTHQLIDEGSLYVAQTATPGSGIVLTSTTGNSFSATQGIFAVNNLDQTISLGGLGRDHIPLWLKIIITNVGNAGTDDHFAVAIDKGARASGGTASLTGKNLNPSYANNDDVSQIIAGVPTLAAATNNAFYCGRAEGRKATAPAYVAGDVVHFIFGSPEQVQAQSIATTTNIGLVLPMPAIVIPPGWCWALLEWMPNRITTAQSAEIEYGYVLR